MKKNILWNTIGSSLAAISSLVFLVIVTRINGMFDAGIFTFCFSTACLLYTIGIYQTRAYQVTDITKTISDSDYIYNRITTGMIMVVLSVIFSIVMKYSFYKTAILVLLTIYKFVEVFQETLYGILQKRDKLYEVGISMTIRSLLAYIFFFISDIISNNVIISIIVIIVINVLEIVIKDVSTLKKISIKVMNYKKENNVKLLKNGISVCLFSFLSIYILNSSRYSIDILLDENMQTIFGIIVMPGMIMSLLSQFIIQPFMVKITTLIEKKEYMNIDKLLTKLLCYMLCLGILALLAAYILGIPFLNIIYNIKLDNYKILFIIIVIGSILYGMCIIISSFLIALRKNKEQLLILGIVSVIALLASYILVKELAILGATLNYLIVMLIELMTYYILFKSTIRKEM